MKLPQGLPHLDGARGRIARAIYLVLAGLTLVVIAGSLVFNGLDFFRNMPAAMQWGFRTYTVAGHPQIADVSREVLATGIRVGDRIVAIQGRTVPANATEFTIGARLDAVSGDRLVLITTDKAGKTAAHSLRRLPAVWQRIDGFSGLPLWLYATGTFLSIEIIPIFLLAASFLLYRRRPNDPEAMLFAIGFVLLSNLPDVAFWLLAMFGVTNTVFNALASTGWCAIFIAIAGFPDGRFASRWSKLVVVAIIPIIYFSLMVSFTPIAGVLIVRQLSGLATILIVAMTLVAVTMRYRSLAQGPERQQIKWVVFGFCVTAISAMVITFLPPPSAPAFKGDAGYFVFFTIARLFVFLPLPIGLLVSLLRYRLYDAEATISRSAAYAVLTVSLLAVFAASEKVIEILGEQYFAGSAGAIAGSISAAIAAVLIVPMHHRVNHWAEHRFQKGLLRLKNGLPALVGDLRETAGIDQIARATLARVAEGVPVHGLAFVVHGTPIATRDVEAGTVEAWLAHWTPDDAQKLDCDRSDPDFPLRIPLRLEGSATFGWILLGPRPDGSFYGRDERAALAEIADPVARAVTIVSQRRAMEVDQAQVTTRLSARIQQLEETVGRLLGGRPGIAAE